MTYEEAYQICEVTVRCFGYLEYPGTSDYEEVVIATDRERKVYIVELFHRDYGREESGLREVFTSEEAAEAAARQYIHEHYQKHGLR
jgi:hypothetical protein